MAPGAVSGQPVRIIAPSYTPQRPSQTEAAEMSKENILKEFALFSLGGDGIGAWLTEKTDEEVFRRLDRIDQEPLSKVQLNQLLVFGHEAPVSDDFFRYYWLEAPSEHPYPVSKLPGFLEPW